MSDSQIFRLRMASARKRRVARSGSPAPGASPPYAGPAARPHPGRSPACSRAILRERCRLSTKARPCGRGPLGTGQFAIGVVEAAQLFERPLPSVALIRNQSLQHSKRGRFAIACLRDGPKVTQERCNAGEMGDLGQEAADLRIRVLAGPAGGGRASGSSAVRLNRMLVFDCSAEPVRAGNGIRHHEHRQRRTSDARRAQGSSPGPGPRRSAVNHPEQRLPHRLHCAVAS